MHSSRVAAPGQLLSWPLDTALGCHNVTPSWPPPLTATLGPYKPPTARQGAQVPSREGQGRRPRDEDGCASNHCPPTDLKRLWQKRGPQTARPRTVHGPGTSPPA